MTDISRRSALAIAAAVVSGAVVPAVHAAPAKVPSIWDGKMMWETFSKSAHGFSYPGPAGRPKAYVAIDTQCPDCMRLMEHIRPLHAKIDVVYCPIAWMNIHSDAQGAMIFASDKPWEVLDAQHEHFRDEGFRGLRYDITKLSEKFRNWCWDNSKLHRRCGCRAVPYGVFKNSKGEYVPFDENLTTAELAKIFEVTL